jgi:hypothetical protein
MKIVNAETAELKVVYCIPDWLRDQNISMNVAKYPNRIQKFTELKDEPIALVCFGPSLNETWEQIKGFKNIISCSGSHKFLIDRGVVPTYHVEVDPRAHKIKLIGEKIDPNTEFLLASCVHPNVFAHIEKLGGKITVWHTYSGEKKDKLPNVYPRGEWVLTGGANVGLRALTIARFLGYRDIHVFGMDGSFPAVEGGLKHAEHHPSVTKDYILAEYEGKQYATTTAFLECARSTFHELEMLPDVNVKFYGDGLIQEMAKKKILNKKQSNNIAFFTSPTISDEYINQNRLLHQFNPVYGVSVLAHKDTILKLYEVTGSKSLLDYGCGKGLLAKELDFPIWEYDPAIPTKDAPPRPADFVVCIDVLEHIEPDYLEATLSDLARCVKEVGYFVIATYQSKKTLPDGRNTHLIIEGKEWWREKLVKFFAIADKGILEGRNKELHVIVSPKQGHKMKVGKLELKQEEVMNVNQATA